MSCSSSISCGAWGGGPLGVCVCLTYSGPALCFNYAAYMYFRDDVGNVTISGPIGASASLENGKIKVCFGQEPPENAGEFRWTLAAEFCGTTVGTCGSSFVCIALAPGFTTC